MEGSTSIRLRAYLTETGTMPVWLAREVGVSRSHMANWLAGRQPVPERHRLEIIRVLRARQLRPISADLFETEADGHE